VLGIAACANLGAGVVLAWRNPVRAGDLRAMYEWCRPWLLHGEHLYFAAGQNPDYPPNAIVLLSPMAVLPWRWVVPLWAAGALVLTPLLAYIVMRCAWRGDRSQVAVPVLLVLCWASAHTLLQFTVLSMTLAFVAVRIADTRSEASGVLLGLALFKPHIAGPIWLWTATTGRARVAIVAVAVVCAEWALYCVRAAVNPLATLIEHARFLSEQYGGAGGLTGLTSVRGWAQLLSADSRISDALWIGTAALLLAIVCWLARRDPRRAVNAGGLAVPGLFCLWSLLTFYHNGNNLMLALPAFAWLWFIGDRRAGIVDWAPLAAWQAVLMLDVPLRLGGVVAPGGWASSVIAHFDRAAVLMMFVLVSVRWYRLTRVVGTR
jgi:hypothetical protein